ncbi:hypothetical protein Ahu01nite_072180 [Winogradskya humida]|uniref:LPXTG-motif cell wall-anchored protein n=2 Tax=Winogradskya humida TaxID=113566 RepID=A0ABQ3ZZU8_9ACTN|nr:hypothetical protein Ahu01nite_072180 [Actinoplanes humidus]
MAGLILAAPLPAAAAPPDAAPAIGINNLTMVANGAIGIQYTAMRIPAGGVLHDVRATIDLSGVAGVVAVDSLTQGDGEGCTRTADLITCDIGTADKYDLSIATVRYRTAVGAAAGDQGTVVLTVTGKEFKPLTRKATVLLAKHVDYTGAPYFQDLTGRPGATVTPDLGVYNQGLETIHGIDVYFRLDPRLTLTKRYSNCYYGTSTGYCHFDDELARTTWYTTSEPLKLRISPQSPAPFSAGTRFNWMTPADGLTEREKVEAEKPAKGTAGQLSLVRRVSAAKATVPETDPDAEDILNQSVEVKVTGKQTADLAAVGAVVTGDVGATVVAGVGTRNLGPAMVGVYLGPIAVVTVTPPDGTTVVGKPGECEPSGGSYVCTRKAAAPLLPGGSVVFPFTLRIDKAGTLRGRVVSKGEWTEQTPDHNHGNDTAALVVNPPAAGGTTPPGDDGGPGGEGGSGGGGGTLPITGANAAVIGVAGALLIAGGIVAFVVTRRRKSRFEA